MSSQELFKLHANYQPAGDQVKAIEDVSQWISQGVRDMCIHGITGSGKTFTMANIIAKANRPALIYSPNKILAYQLYEEFRAFFPENQVHYFVSTFDLYIPEYVKHGEFHTKQSVANAELEQMVLAATESLSKGERDVIIVASSSCLFGTGSPEMYQKATTSFSLVDGITKDQLVSKLMHAGYNFGQPPLFTRGVMHDYGSLLKICSSAREKEIQVWELKFDPEETLMRIDFKVFDEFGNEVKTMSNMKHGYIFPATRYAQDVYTLEEMDLIGSKMLEEAASQRNKLSADKYEQLVQRIDDDIATLKWSGYCNGIENYAWYFNRANFKRKFSPQDYETMSPYTLFSYLPKDTLMFIDESHLALGQIEGVSHADYSRKQDLIKAGIRLPSCVINRPLKKQEVRDQNLQTVYVSATPRQEELDLCGEYKTELFIRPTYLLDPDIEMVYVDDLDKRKSNVKEHVAQLIVNTKGATLLRCPDTHVAHLFLNDLRQRNIKAAVMLADTPAPERRELVERLQDPNHERALDVLIGVNLIREGLDIPRVENVIITYADKGGFLNDTTSLIQIIGRAARNANGKVYIYVQNENMITPQVAEAVKQTLARRKKQQAYNQLYGKTPITAQANSYLTFDALDKIYTKEDDLLEEHADLHILDDNWHLLDQEIASIDGTTLIEELKEKTRRKSKLEDKSQGLAITEQLKALASTQLTSTSKSKQAKKSKSEKANSEKNKSKKANSEKDKSKKAKSSKTPKRETQATQEPDKKVVETPTSTRLRAKKRSILVDDEDV